MSENYNSPHGHSHDEHASTSSSHHSHSEHGNPSHHSHSSHSEHRGHSHHASSSHKKSSSHNNSDRARRARMKKSKKIESLKKSIRKVAYRKESYEKRASNSKKEWKAPRKIPARLTPAVLYLEGFFALLLVLSHTDFAARFDGTVLNALLFEMPIPALTLLLGYRTKRRADEVKSKRYDRPYFTYILPPALSLYMIPFAVTFGAFLLLRKVITGSWGAFSANGLSFLGGDYGPSAYFGWIALQLILLFPLIFIIKKQTEELRRKRKKKTTSNARMPWPAHIAGFVILYELLVNWVAISPAAYRLLCFRLLLAFALGVYLYETRHKEKSILLYGFSFLLGVLYLVGITLLTAYGQGKMPDWMPLFQGWAYTNAASCLYFCPPIALILYRAQRNSLPHAADVPLRLLGKASYYLVVVQAAYFALRIHFPVPSALHALIDLVICTIVALLLYALSRLPLFSALYRLFSVVEYNLTSILSRLRSAVIITWCRQHQKFLSKRLRRLMR